MIHEWSSVDVSQGVGYAQPRLPFYAFAATLEEMVYMAKVVKQYYPELYFTSVAEVKWHPFGKSSEER